MTKEFFAKKTPFLDTLNNIFLIVFPIGMPILLILLFIEGEWTPFVIFLIGWLWITYLSIEWFLVSKGRQIKSIKCNFETLEILLTTIKEEKIESNLELIKYDLTSIGEIGDLKINGKNYYGIRYLIDWDELKVLIYEHCKRIY